MVEKLLEYFSSQGFEVFKRNEKRIYVRVPVERLGESAERVLKEGGRFATASCVDTRRGYEILYHFPFDSEGIILSLKVLVSREEPVVPSLARLRRAFEWIEREIHEFFGVIFEGHPDLRPLLSSEDRPPKFFPFRRDRERYRSEELWKEE